MAFLNRDFGSQYIDDFYNDRIPQGLGINVEPVDKHVSWKRGQYNIVIGVDNVGKTDFMLWYYLTLALTHEMKFDVWSGENKPEQQKRKLMQMYLGCSIKDASYKEVQKAKLVIENYFNWVDRKHLYNHEELLDLFSDSEAQGFFIDPINGLDHKMKFGSTEMTYRFSNDVRLFCSQTNKTIFVSAHTVTEASRRTYPKEHELYGYQQPPIKSMIEGGQPFASRADDFWIINRLINHEFLRFFTQLEIQKVKDTESGGLPTLRDKPLCFEYNNGYGYKYSYVDILDPSSVNCATIDPLDGLRMKRTIVKQPTKKEIQKAITPEQKEKQYTQIKPVKHWQETEKDDLFDHTELWD